MRNDIFSQSQITPHKLLINYKKEKSDFTIEKPGKDKHNQVI